MCGLPLRQSTPRASSTSVSRPATNCLIAFVGTKRPSAASVIPAPIPAHLRGKFGFTRLGRNARDGIPVGLLLLRAVGFRCALPAAGREESIELVLVIDDAFAELVVGGWEARPFDVWPASSTTCRCVYRPSENGACGNYEVFRTMADTPCEQSTITLTGPISLGWRKPD